MPVPTNLDWTTAIDLGAFPANIVQDVHDSGTTYTVWYKFTAVSGFNLAGIFCFGDLVGYKPTINIFTETGGILNFWPQPGGVVAATNKPIQFPVTVGTVFYIQCVKNGNFATSILTINAQYFTNQVAPAESILINDDQDGFGAMILSSTVDFTPLRYIYPFPSGEAGDRLISTGRYLIGDDFHDLIKLYENDITHLLDITPPWIFQSLIRACQGGNKFYIGSLGLASEDAKLTSVSNTGVLGGTVFTLGSSMLSFCVKDDETIAYYSGVGGATNSEIKRWNLITNSAMSDLVADIGGSYTIPDMLYLSDDTIIVVYRSFPAPNDTFIRRIDALTGATLNTYPIGLGVSSPTRVGYTNENPLSFLAYTHYPVSSPDFGKSLIKKIRCSDGVDLLGRLSVEYEGGTYQPAETATPISRFGQSTSCPILLTSAQVGTPTTGTIVVNKITSPSGNAQTFNFSSPGLSPTTFTLEDGESQVFNNVPVGIYSIVETVPSGWSVSYSVSDGSPNTALNLSAGEVIIVNVTNTLISTSASGIYKLVPGKRNDTLWINVDAGTTRDVKIPNPFIKTGLIGE